MTLKEELEYINPSIEHSSWRGHEHVRGYGIFALPLSSGHTLALRVFPINDFSPYITVWHQTPDGTWSIYYDALRADIACPRYYGLAVQNIVRAKIHLIWRGPMELMIKMNHPQLEWGRLHVINSINWVIRKTGFFLSKVGLWTIHHIA
jgi:hypothetical protein